MRGLMRGKLTKSITAFVSLCHVPRVTVIEHAKLVRENIVSLARCAPLSPMGPAIRNASCSNRLFANVIRDAKRFCQRETKGRASGDSGPCGKHRGSVDCPTKLTPDILVARSFPRGRLGRSYPANRIVCRY